MASQECIKYYNTQIRGCMALGVFFTLASATESIQLVQRVSAHLVFNLPKCSHNTPLKPLITLTPRRSSDTVHVQFLTLKSLHQTHS